MKDMGDYMMKKRILFCFAHPDDESFTVGGVLSKYSQHKDIETIVYTATLGDAGKCGNPPVCTKDELAKVRENELKEAASILGVDILITDTYKDGKLQTLADGELTQSVKNIIHQYKPETVVTFPPHGISGHPDHLAIQRAVFEAVTTDENTPVNKLFYVTVPSNVSLKPPYTDPIDSIDVIECFGVEEARKVQKALQAHRTQHLSVEMTFPTIYEEEFEKYGNCEYFMLAWKKSDNVRHDVLI
jgi:N-acetylglucosamine malate deacetylase 2